MSGNANILKHVKHSAWLSNDGETLRAEAEDFDDLGWTAVLRLIHGVYLLKGEWSLRYLRKPIFTTARESQTIQRIVRVGAKRVCYAVEFPSQKSTLIDAPLWEKTASRLQDRCGILLNEPIQVCHELLSTIPERQRLFQTDRLIAALALDSEGKLLGAAVNTNHTSRLFHAEVNLALEFQARTGRKFPSGTRIYTTLSPCQMCAEILAELSEDGHRIAVIAQKLDVGKLGRNRSLLKLDIMASP